MRLALFPVLLLGCGAPDDTGAGDPVGAAPTVVDVLGDWGPEAAPKGRVRAVHLRFDLGEAALAFNDTGVIVANPVPAGGATPLLPLPTDEVSMQLLDAASRDLAVLAASEPLPVDGGFGLVAVYGHEEEPRSLGLRIDPTPVSGRVKIRAVHTTPGLPYIALVDGTGATLAALGYGDDSAYFDVAADATQRWAADLTGDGVPDLPFSGFSLPAADSLGFGQVVDLFVIPSGSTLPGPVPLPVPVLLLVPLDAPDGIVVVTPDV